MVVNMSNVVRAGMDGSMIAIALGWLLGFLPHLAWIIPTIYYAVLLSKEWPPACAFCTWVRSKIVAYTKGFKAGVKANQAETDAKPQDEK